MSKTFMSVKGKISESEMGITLPHEHLLIDIRNWLVPLDDKDPLRSIVNQPVMLENRGEIIYAPNSFLDNLKPRLSSGVFMIN